MKPETTRGARRLLPRRKRTSSRADGGRADRPEAAGRAGAEPGVEGDFDPVEFAEFLDADDGPIPIDPDFRERLRERLWDIVQARFARVPDGDPAAEAGDGAGETGAADGDRDAPRGRS